MERADSGHGLGSTPDAARSGWPAATISTADEGDDVSDPRDLSPASAGPAAWPGMPSCATGFPAGSRHAEARSRSPAGCATSSPASQSAGCARRRSTKPSTGRTSGGLPRELPGRVLRLRRRHRLARRHARARRAGPVTGMTLIHERPAEALGREQPAHWKGDLIVGAGNASAIVTMVERTTRFTLPRLGQPRRPHGYTPRTTVRVATLTGTRLITDGPNRVVIPRQTNRPC